MVTKCLSYAAQRQVVNNAVIAGILFRPQGKPRQRLYEPLGSQAHVSKQGVQVSLALASHQPFFFDICTHCSWINAVAYI